MLMNNETRERLIELNKEELVVLRERVKCFDNPEERKKLNYRYDEINREIGDIIYFEEIEHDAYYTIPEIKETLEEMAGLEHEYYILKNREEEKKSNGIITKKRPWNFS